jgi:hypothetical protein
LEGVRVLEYCCTHSGPYCTKLMADLGAEVIHVEPQTGDDARDLALSRRRPASGEDVTLSLTNKLGITLNPGASQGKEIFSGWQPGGRWSRTHLEHTEGLGLDTRSGRETPTDRGIDHPLRTERSLQDYRAPTLNISHAGRAEATSSFLP